MKKHCISIIIGLVAIIGLGYYVFSPTNHDTPKTQYRQPGYTADDYEEEIETFNFWELYGSGTAEINNP